MENEILNRDQFSQIAKWREQIKERHKRLVTSPDDLNTKKSKLYSKAESSGRSIQL
jgi:hypothetical protein